MNLKQALSMSLIALASTAALADGGDIGTSNYPLTTGSAVSRHDVQSAVVAARADGELRVAGEAGDTPYAFGIATPSTVSRGEVKLATLRAARAGQLVPAGEGAATLPNGEMVARVAGSDRHVFASLAARLRGAN